MFTINTTTWSYAIHFNTTIIICSAISIVFAGELFARITSFKVMEQLGKSEQKGGLKQILKPFYFSKKIAFLLSIILLGFIVLRLKDINYIKDMYGQGEYFFDVYTTYRQYGKYIQFNRLMDVIAMCFGYVCILAYTNSLVFKRKNYVRYLILLVLCVINFTLTANRITVIYLFVSLAFMWLIQYAYINRWNYISKETFKKTAKISGILILLFLLLGTLTGKTQRQDGLFQNISIYLGSSIPALDVWLQDFSYDIGDFGKRTLFGITNLFNYIGIDFTFTEERNSPFIFVGDMSKRTNVYTGLRALLSDYNYFGMYVILFLEGALLYKLYLKVKRDLSNGRFTFVLLYAYVITLFSLTSIAERIIVELFTISTALFMIITIWVVKKVEKGTRNNRQKTRGNGIKDI